MRIDDVPIGTRVTIRSRDDDGWLNDAVGELTSRDGATVTVETRRGPKTVEVARIVALKVIPPRPERPNRREPGEQP